MIGNKVCFFETLESTNTFMKEHPQQFRDGDMIVAKIQTKGRGRRNNKWVSKLGNLHASLYLEKTPKKTPFGIVMRVSLAVLGALEEFDVKANIKYPNDIVVGRQKIAGILIESTEDHYIIGIGINVTFNDVDGYDFHPSSILLESSRLVDYRDVLSAFIKAYNDLETDSMLSLLTQYKDRSIVIGNRITYEDRAVLIHDITEDGKLVIDDESVKQLQPNEVTLTSWYDES